MIKYARKCDQCNKVFNEGYCIAGGESYYCSEECLHKAMSEEEIKDLEIGEDDSDSYYTEWECPEDFQYYEDGTEIEETGIVSDEWTCPKCKYTGIAGCSEVLDDNTELITCGACGHVETYEPIKTDEDCNMMMEFRGQHWDLWVKFCHESGKAPNVYEEPGGNCIQCKKKINMDVKLAYNGYCSSCDYSNAINDLKNGKPTKYLFSDTTIKKITKG